MIFENGLPKLAEVQSEEEIITWKKKPLKIALGNKCQLGQDCLEIFFRINEKGDFYIKCFDVEEKFLGEFKLGNIF